MNATYALLVGALLLLHFGVAGLYAQDIELQGIPNRYARVLAIEDCRRVQLAHTLGFAAGDRVLIIQMQGARIDTNAGPAYGRVLEYSGAGFYEFNTISAIEERRVTLAAELVRDYDPAGAIQLIRVPRAANAVITGNLFVPLWDGSTGGVLVLEVENTLRMEADINVSGAGFRGGRVSVAGHQLDKTAYRYPYGSGLGAEKGEGVSAVLSGYEAGRGAQANGGGGANDHNAGGGGGGNLAAGGKGGFQFNGVGRRDIGGLPGVALESHNGIRAFMGGGGGGGHQNNLVGTAGTAGGGIVIIRAETMAGNGYYIYANGLGQLEAAEADGAGGGGAGGSVLLDVGEFSSRFHVEIRGGKGGDSRYEKGCVGPGGGGAGGILWLSGNSVVHRLWIDSRPGEPGAMTHPGSPCYAEHYGAEPGSYGEVRSGLQITESASFHSTQEIGGARVFCAESSAELHGPPGFARYEWSNGANGAHISVSTAGEYGLSVWNTLGCRFDLPPVSVERLELPQPEIQGRTLLCPGESTGLRASGTWAEYYWSTGARGRETLIEQPGVYYLSVLDSNGCTGHDTIVVHAMTEDVLNLAPDLEQPEYEFVSIMESGLHCETLVLVNNSTEELLIEEAELRQHVHFAVPPSNVPLSIAPGATGELRICFSPPRPGLYRDTLLVHLGCFGKTLPLLGRGLPLGLSGLSHCDVEIVLSADAESEGRALVSYPYPNPASEEFTLTTVSDAALTRHNPAALVCDMFGNVLLQGVYRRRPRDPQGRHIGDFIFPVRGLEQGIYLVAVYYGTHSKAFPLAVVR